MPFFFFVELSVKMKRGEKLSFALCDRWKKRSVTQNIFGVTLLFFLETFQQQRTLLRFDPRLEGIRKKASSLYFVKRFLHAVCYEL